MSLIDTLDALTAEDAAVRLCSLVRPVGIERVLLEDASGRVLAEDYITPFPMPPFRRAAMDGYAVRSADLAEASPERPVTLNVTGEVKAGSMLPVLHEPSGPKEAVRIFTGAPVPDGWDTLVVQEAVPAAPRRLQPGTIRLSRSFRSGEHIAAAGEDMPAGAAALAKGSPLGPKEIALLASFGQAEVAVYGKPKVTVVPVGDELLTAGERLQPYRIYDANGYMTEARLRELGAEVRRLSPVPDAPEAIERAIRSALAASDIVVTTGGVSVGDYDFVAQAAEAAGSAPIFRKVLMRPGKPTSAFKAGDRLILALSGNPSACFAGLELLAKPVVRKAAGRRDYLNRYVEGVLAAEVAKGSPLARFVRSRAYWREGRLYAEPLGRDKAGNIAAFAETNALAVISPGTAGAAAGDKVRLLLLGEPLG